MSEYPSAAEVIARAVADDLTTQSGDLPDRYVEWVDPDDLTSAVLGALREAGWAVEKLPEPDHRVEATEDENGRTDYESGDVSVFDDGEIHVFGAVWEPAAAWHFGLSLLAAAAVSQDGEK